MLGRPPWTPPGNGVWSATAACPSGRYRPQSGTSRCSNRGSGTARPADERETFRSAILPPYLRKTPSLEALYPWLYLKGISTGGFGEALQALLGPEARGLSGDDPHAAEGSVGARVPGLVEAVVGVHALRLRSGPTACTSTSGSRTRTTNGNAFWC